MSLVLVGLGQFAMTYLDDILVFSRCANEHLRHVQTVLVRFGKYCLKIKIPKCQFMMKKTKYLGFIINRGGIHLDVDKVEVIKAMPENLRSSYSSNALLRLE